MNTASRFTRFAGSPVHMLYFRRGISFLRPRHIKASLNELKDSLTIDHGAPGLVIGTVNEAYKHPIPDYNHGSYHWTYERIVGVSLVPLTISPFIVDMDLPFVESILASLITLHSYYGFESCIIDYIPLRKFKGWHKMAMNLLRFGSLVSLYGVYQLETEGPGLFEWVRRLWRHLS